MSRNEDKKEIEEEKGKKMTIVKRRERRIREWKGSGEEERGRSKRDRKEERK